MGLLSPALGPSREPQGTPAQGPADRVIDYMWNRVSAPKASPTRLPIPSRAVGQALTNVAGPKSLALLWGLRGPDRRGQAPGRGPDTCSAPAAAQPAPSRTTWPCLSLPGRRPGLHTSALAWARRGTVQRQKALLGTAACPWLSGWHHMAATAQSMETWSQEPDLAQVELQPRLFSSWESAAAGQTGSPRTPHGEGTPPGLS